MFIFLGIFIFDISKINYDFFFLVLVTLTNLLEKKNIVKEGKKVL